MKQASNVRLRHVGVIRQIRLGQEVCVDTKLDPEIIFLAGFEFRSETNENNPRRH